MTNTWSPEQLKYLKENYALTKQEVLMDVLKKSKDQIRWKAKEFKLTKKISKTHTDASFLEDFNNPESLYWWGFLTADGCITPKQIIFSLEEKDAEYVKKFAVKCKSNVKKITRINSWHKVPYTMVRTVVNDSFLIARLIKRLKIKPQKTYNPFDISEFLEKSRLLYYFAGLVDGDGYIGTKKKGRVIVIKVHYNWHKSFDLISKKLNDYYGLRSTSYISKTGWAMLKIGHKEDMKILFSLLDGKVPIMPRKWDAIRDF